MKRAAWFLLALVCFGLATVSGVIAAQGFFFDSLSWRVLFEHAVVISFGGSVAVAFLFGCVLCVEKVVQ